MISDEVLAVAEELLRTEDYQNLVYHGCVICGHLPSAHSFMSGECLFVPGGTYTNGYFSPGSAHNLTWGYIHRTVTLRARRRLAMTA